MIGTQEYANELALGIVTRDWRHLGTGAYRAAWLGPDNVVYKVEVDDEGSPTPNEEEYENYIRFGPRPAPGIRIPEMTLYYPHDIPILAMEYVPGLHHTSREMDPITYDRVADMLTAWQKSSQMVDCWDYNVKYLDNVVYLIDITH